MRHRWSLRPTTRLAFALVAFALAAPLWLGANLASGQAPCTADWQCGNVPFAFCFFEPQAAAGSCRCRSIFSGGSCTACEGVVQWTAQGLPRCVPLDPATGLPASCGSDWECLNVPFARCNGEGACECAEGFSGQRCSGCSGSVQWEGGLPTCVPTTGGGLPASCREDWQCGNAPFTLCRSSSCRCAAGFVGEQCSRCPSGQVQWDQGLPFCLPS
jgi:hypothetical protein